VLLRKSHTAWLKCIGAPSCILSAVIHKLNVSGHMLMWTFFLVLVYGICARSLFSPFSYTCIAVKMAVMMEEWSMMLSSMEGPSGWEVSQWAYGRGCGVCCYPMGRDDVVKKNG
jgi:hypothetical protein